MFVRVLIDFFKKDEHYGAAKPEQKKYIVVHRLDFDSDPILVKTAFNQTHKGAAGEFTGGKFPYHIYILRNGDVWICLELSDIAAAARGFNLTGIHIACQGDFRRGHESMAAEQYQSLREMCALLVAWTEEGVNSVLGHDEAIEKSGIPSYYGLKECPGDNLELSKLRRDVGEELGRHDLTSFEAECLMTAMGMRV